MRSFLLAGVGLVAGVFTISALGDTPAPRSVQAAPSVRQMLLSHYPGLQEFDADDRVRAFYGVPMTFGATAQQAIDAFWTSYGDAFGVPGLQLTANSIHTSNGDKFTVGMYQQKMAGLPVENTVGRILVNNWLGQVTYVTGIFADAPVGGFAPLSVPAEAAVAWVSSLDDYKSFDQWSAPELVVYAGTADEMGYGPGRFGAPVRAWKFTGGSSNLSQPARRTFFVDAANGTLVATRNEIYYTDVSGTVNGNATPGLLPDTASNPATLQPINDVRVSISGGANAFSDPDGFFTIANGGSAPVTLTTNVSSGRWVNVNTQVGAELTLSQSVTPPGPATLTFNPAPSPSTTAQVNALIHTDHIHNFITDRCTWTGIDSVIVATVNLNNTCNAFFDGSGINFFSAGGGCPNSAYSTVVSHEYGHFIVNRLGLSQGPFGEGFGDCCSILLYDTPIIADDFFNGSQPIRDYSPGVPEDTYPCGGSCTADPHCCGEILGGTWRDIREQMGILQGEPTGLDYTRQLFVDWLQITVGGSGNNPAWAQTAIEVLTVDDDDGNIENGTPNFAALRTAFEAHNVPFPDLPPVIVDFPSGFPTILQAETPTTISMTLVPGSSVVTPGSPTLHVKVGAGSFTSIPMPLTGENLYAGEIPGQACGASLNYYVSYATPETGELVYPPGSPDAAVPAIAVQSTTDILNDDMETDTGWTVSGDAWRGMWDRAAPEATSAQPGSDHSGGGGTLCWVTDHRAGPSVATYDVDHGSTILTSPVLDCSGGGDAQIAYWRWYSNSVYPFNNADVFVIDITNNGADWVNVETIGPAGPQTAGGWYYHSFRVADFVAPTATVQMRFNASDQNIDSNVEAALDDFHVFTASCEGGGCAGDLDGDHSVNIADLAILLANFGTAGGATPNMGDSDGDGDVDLTDLAALLNRFGSGC